MREVYPFRVIALGHQYPRFHRPQRAYCLRCDRFQFGVFVFRGVARRFQHLNGYFVEFAPTTIHEKKFAYVESNKNSMLVDHEKKALGAGYIVEFIHRLQSL